MNTVDNKMSRTRFLSLCVVLILSITALPAADEEGLRAAFDSALEALSNKDLGKFLEIWHPPAVLFTRNQTYAIDRAQLDDREWAKLFEDTFGKVISIGFPQRAVKFRVVGDTGMVWGMGGGECVDDRDGSLKGHRVKRHQSFLTGLRLDVLKNLLLVVDKEIPVFVHFTFYPWHV